MQRQEDLIVGLDIGTTKICAVVGEMSGPDINIIGIGTHPSIGLRKGVGRTRFENGHDRPVPGAPQELISVPSAEKRCTRAFPYPSLTK